MTRDHPRVCGEKEYVDREQDAEKGSPPRVRGKVNLPTNVVDKRRDHPRVCGEK